MTDSAGVLGHAIRRDGVDINRRTARGLGHAVLYVIWPNAGRFEDYRAAEIEAQVEPAGIWNPAAPLTELPFEYRLRIDRDTPFRPVGDYFTRNYVEPPTTTACTSTTGSSSTIAPTPSAAGYVACPRTGTGDYAASCFAPGR